MARRPVATQEKGRAWVHVRVPVELKREAAHKLLDEGKTFTGLVEAALREYVRETE